MYTQVGRENAVFNSNVVWHAAAKECQPLCATSSRGAFGGTMRKVVVQSDLITHTKIRQEKRTLTHIATLYAFETAATIYLIKFPTHATTTPNQKK